MSSKSALKNKLERLEEDHTTDEKRDSDLGSVIQMSERHQIENTDDPDIEDKINYLIQYHKE